jgi:diguanylate cyclase (GGDEF)-like protein
MPEKIINRFDYFVSHLPRHYLLLITTIIILALGILDYLTGSEISISLFFFFPIAVITWYLGPRYGGAFSLLSTILWALVQRMQGFSYSTEFVRYWGVVMHLAYYVLVVLASNYLKNAFDTTRRQAITDPLTGILNSREFYRLLAIEMLRVQRNNQAVTIAFLDLDNFKLINDRYGHQVGDELIQLVSQTIAGSLRRTDLFARVGGDEFAILLPGADAHSAGLAAHKIQEDLAVIMREHGYPVTFSLGALAFASPPPDIQKALREADALMYQAKARGKNNFIILEAE